MKIYTTNYLSVFHTMHSKNTAKFKNDKIPRHHCNPLFPALTTAKTGSFIPSPSAPNPIPLLHPSFSNITLPRLSLAISSASPPTTSPSLCFLTPRPGGVVESHFAPDRSLGPVQVVRLRIPLILRSSSVVVEVVDVLKSVVYRCFPDPWDLDPKLYACANV